MGARDDFTIENYATMCPDVLEPMVFPLAQSESKKQPAAVASKLMLPQSFEADFIGHVIREELLPVQQLVQEWAARQKTCENRVAVLEQRFNHFSTHAPLSSLSL